MWVKKAWPTTAQAQCAYLEVEPNRSQYEIRWPNVLRIESVLKRELVMDWTKVDVLTLNPMTTPLTADVAPSLTSAQDSGDGVGNRSGKGDGRFPPAEPHFRAARKLQGSMQSASSFGGDKQYLAVQLIPVG